MSTDGAHTQKIYLGELNDDASAMGRKASRIELRTLRDAYKLKTTETTVPPVQVDEEEIEGDLKRTTAYCTAEAYNLKDLNELLKRNKQIKQIRIYFEKCLHAVYRTGDEDHDIFFLHYGVVVMWGLEEHEEQNVLRLIKGIHENPYGLKFEVEKFKYGMSRNSQIVNDKILLSEENAQTKMVISIAAAQSVKLDYFEELVDSTIGTVKDLPDEVEKEGKVGKKRHDILRIMGKLHKLSFNLYLVSNILGEPEFIWEYPAFSPLYETCIRYLDIKTRADLLNKRCDIIHGMLEILSENITTHNSEKLERTMTWLIGISVAFGFLQCGILLAIAVKYFMTN